MRPLERKAAVLALLLVVSDGCRTAHVLPSHDPIAEHAAWANAPLSPAIQFNEVVSPRSVRVLVLDAHSGAPMDAARVVLGPADVVADQYGRATIHRAPIGRQLVRVMRPGYQMWRDSVTVTDTTGLAVVVQLRRSSLMLEESTGASRPP